MRKGIDTVEEFWTQEVLKELNAKADKESFSRFSKAFSSFLGVSESSVKLAISGKSALSKILQMRIDERPVVLVSALNCVRVQEAIVEASCIVRTYDFAGQPGVYDWNEILGTAAPDVGVLIVTHFYGVPTDLREALDICKEKGILLVEDCAQTLGGKVAERQVGTMGDASIFSFSYDKPISLGWGGAAVINSNDKFRVGEQSSTPSLLIDARRSEILFQNFCRQIELRRLRIKETKKSIMGLYHRFFGKIRLHEFYESQLPFTALQAELGIYCLTHYQKNRILRNLNAAFFATLSPIETWPIYSDDIEPAWLKQKVLLNSHKQLVTVSQALQKSGIRAGNFNWPTLIDGKSSKKCDVARNVSERWMDVPIHQGMERDHIRKMVSLIERTL